jgi:hypothetical protein
MVCRLGPAVFAVAHSANPLAPAPALRAVEHDGYGASITILASDQNVASNLRTDLCDTRFAD